MMGRHHDHRTAGVHRQPRPRDLRTAQRRRRPAGAPRAPDRRPDLRRDDRRDLRPDPTRPSIKALLRGLRELGYVDGRDFVTEPRAGEGRPERWPVMTAELVRLQVDVIVAPGPILPALKQATATIPIVLAAAPDPVGDGFVRSLGRPGELHGAEPSGNRHDGEATRTPEELIPSAAPVAVLWIGGKPGGPLTLHRECPGGHAWPMPGATTRRCSSSATGRLAQGDRPPAAPRDSALPESPAR